MKPDSPLCGKTTCLRPPAAKDVPFLCELRNDVELQMQLMAQPRANTPERVGKWIERMTEDKQSLFYIIARRRTGAPAGYIQLTQIDVMHGHGELGICIAREAQGLGHGREALALIENYASSVFNLRKILLKVLAENRPATALYQKTGYRTVGVLSRHYYQKGIYNDVVVMEKFLGTE